MIFLYRILFLPLLLLSAPYYLYRMCKRGGYGRDWKHRLGDYKDSVPARANRKRVWIHAVSVGESLAVKPMIDRLLQDSQIEVILSTTTSTAYQLISEWKIGDRFFYCIFPIDFWLFSKRAWNHLQPDLMLLAEGELWGEHLHQATQRKVPVCLINARLSDRSYQRYQKISIARNFLLSKLTAIYCQSSQDEERFSSLLNNNTNVHTLGNLKLDVVSHQSSSEDKAKLYQELGFIEQDQPITVLLGSSTWPGEEELFLQIFPQLREKFADKIDLRLLLVPRHAERRKEIIQLLEKTPYPYHVRSSGTLASPETLVTLADTTGELGTLTQIADLVVIGKSFPPHTEGQTPVEAAQVGKAIICGPSMSNFRVITRSLLESQAILQSSPDQLSAHIEELLSDDQNRQQLGTQAAAWARSHQGSTDRHLTKIAQLLSQ